MAFNIALVSFSVTCILTLVRSYAITGPQGGVNQVTGQRPFRQDFSTFRNSGPAFDLYILSLQQFQQQNQSALLSYYQVAGIHGHPFISFDGVAGPYQAGYCTHSSILFPAWHRPYMALFEQLLWNNAQDIAQTYTATQRAKYQAAATSFRIPYWDWALNATMPDPVNDPMITINTPTGTSRLVNPLYNYTFHPQPSTFDFPPDDPISAYHSTVRYPDDSGVSQPNLANQQLQANAQALHDLTYQLLADQSDYAPFSNTGYTNSRGGSYNSLENMHNAIHDLVGQDGHMAWIPYSSFDPIFWLHHANVDRLFAIWQAIHPDSYTTAEADAEGTFTIDPGSTEDIDTSLTPFHTSNSTLYTSATARSTRPFGYTYPEVIDWNVSTTQLSANVRTALNALYNPTGSISTRSLAPLASRGTFDSRNSSSPSLNATAAEGDGEGKYQYFINIRVDKAALGRPFTMHFFLGAVPNDPAIWPRADALVASHSVLYYPSPRSKASNNTIPTPRNRLTYGQLPLNHALIRVQLSSSNAPITPSNSHSSSQPHTPTHILPTLQTHLAFRIRDFAGQVVETEQLGDSLCVFIVRREVCEEGSGERFPVVGNWESVWDVVGESGEV